MTTTKPQGADGGAIGIRSPLLRLPGEIRNQIWLHLVVIKHFAPLILQTGLEPNLKLDHEPGPKKHSICTSVLRICHQIHQEAWEILYGENFFVITFWSHDAEHRFPTNFNERNFDLLRNTKISLTLHSEETSLADVCHFLQHFGSQQCQFKRLTLAFIIIANTPGSILSKFGECEDFLETICAISVENELEIIFDCWRHTSEAVSTCFETNVRRIAAKKSWAATETYVDPYSPSSRARYILRPDTALSVINDPEPARPLDAHYSITKSMAQWS